MCFSFEADLVAGLAISAVGIDALRHARRPEEVPLAALPLAFGVHHLVEAVVWLGLEGTVGAEVGQVATWAYLLFALAVLPWYVPLAVRASESETRRKAVMSAAAALGAVVSTLLLVVLVSGPVDAAARDLHIGYQIDVPWPALVGVAYVMAVEIPLLASGRRVLRAFGVVNVPVIVLLAWLDVSGFISLWCAWAALASVILLGELHRSRRVTAAALAHQRGGPTPPRS